MEFKKGLLCAAISTSLLTACGSDSDTNPESRNLTDDQKLAAGKFFANEVDTKLMGFARGTGVFAKDLADNSGLFGEQALEDSAELFFQDMMILLEVVYMVSNEFKKLEPQLPLDTPVSLQDDFFGAPESFEGFVTVSENGSYGLDISFNYQFSAEGEDTRNVEVVLSTLFDYVTPEVYGDSAVYKQTVNVSGSVSNTELDVTLENGSIEMISTTPELTEGTSFKRLAVRADKLAANILLNDGISDPVSVEAGVDIVLSQPVQYSEEIGYYYSQEEEGSITVLSDASPINIMNQLPSFVRHFTNPLNVEKIQFTELKVAVGAAGSEDYVLANNLSFIGTNAETYRANREGEGPFETGFTYTISGEDRNVLTLNNSFGSISYEYVANESFEEVEELAIVETPQSIGFINCSIVDRNPVTEHLLEFSEVDCEQNIPVNDESLEEWLDGFKAHSVRIPTVGTNYRNRYLFEEIDIEADEETAIFVTGYSATLDNDANPVIFEISANGEFKFGDQDPTSFELSFNHPDSADYQLALTLGEGNDALNASYDSLTSLIQLNSNIDVLGDESQVEFTLDNSKVIEVHRQYEDEATEEQENAIRETGVFTYSVGSLMIDGAKVADVNAIIGDQLINANNPNILDSDIALSLQFTDGTYPEGEFFTTVEEFAKSYQCEIPVDEGVQLENILQGESCEGEIIETTQRMEGVINLRGLLIAFDEAFQPEEVPQEL